MKCEICEEDIAFFTCRLCSRQVCHADYVNGICKVCEMSLCKVCNKNLAIGSCEICGEIICEECTAYFDGARRICKKCYVK
ncbi:hypothetical protein DJ531_11020 [Sulfolobus sp. A20-N-F6]|nr:hypothetical protein DJ532_13865 [Sulfolobus sp. A20-N-F8]TRM78941.1 hypothetical protein DJ528_03590 [Sulfolobus sp. B5]TRM81404.1 hypothetical protein DJ531_11020 [Sulfolobus sp. A20-N-F6]TRM84357.1 hypothetical protein DJ522_05045 [Sulfolobus sp. F3]TRM87807.1 hypothetical protein DJ521_02985 [Sulfolobus sp. E3]TRM88510.1 hypothetical protein DJ529_05185 [Sulfolobus sp. C3]TRM97877.1 hypothetical protein DJ530_11775 [Sulfolobus sp. E1]TRM99619.1 hypothetical protein DJ527_08330 [Sulfol